MHCNITTGRQLESSLTLDLEEMGETKLPAEAPAAPLERL
jgi:hypothetical protein